jgi:hypothetical protein
MRKEAIGELGSLGHHHGTKKLMIMGLINTKIPQKRINTESFEFQPQKF